MYIISIFNKNLPTSDILGLDDVVVLFLAASAPVDLLVLAGFADDIELVTDV